MKFLLDENFPRAATAFLEALGHRAFHLLDYEAQGVPDKSVIERARALDAVLLTTDKDFFHTVPFLVTRHPGIIVVSLRQPNRKAILTRLEWFLASAPRPLAGETYMLRDTTYIVARKQRH